MLVKVGESAPCEDVQVGGSHVWRNAFQRLIDFISAGIDIRQLFKVCFLEPVDLMQEVQFFGVGFNSREGVIEFVFGDRGVFQNVQILGACLNAV